MSSDPTQLPYPTAADVSKVRSLVWMRTRHHATVDQGSMKDFRRRAAPVSVMPRLRRACGHHGGLSWLPPELVEPHTLPPESKLPTSYVLRYYGLSKVLWQRYMNHPVDPKVPWRPEYAWNKAFPPTGDGWSDPTSDETFVRLRLQGPNPWMLRRGDDRPGPDGVPEPRFVLDFSDTFAGRLPAVVAEFAVRAGSLTPIQIRVGDQVSTPGDELWDHAKRTVNAVDARYVVFGRHLFDVHLLLGQAFALATFSLPSWHPLRPFMAFFTYGTMHVNKIAYQALLTPTSYFLASGFAAPADVEQIFRNGVDRFDLTAWNAPRDIAERGLAAIPDHPYVADATLIWPVLSAWLGEFLDDAGLDDQAVTADENLQGWYRTLVGLLPNVDASQPLNRERLEELCLALLWNNVVHEICGDLSPILGGTDPADKAMTNLADVRAALDAGGLGSPIAAPSMADVFLMDQAMYVSRFNVGGNALMRIDAAQVSGDPRLWRAVPVLQSRLAAVETELIERNRPREVSFNRMLPSRWEASVSF